MKFKMKTLFSSSFSELGLLPDNFDDPVIVTDKNLTVVTKNQLGERLFGGLRRGYKMNRFMSDESVKTLDSLGFRQTAYVELTVKNIVFGATAFGMKRGIIFIISPQKSRILKRIENIHETASGYDVNVSTEQTQAEQTMALFLEGFGELRDVVFFDAHSMLDSVMAELKNTSESVYNRITTKLPSTASWVFGSEYDFTAVLVYGIFVMSDLTSEDIHLTLKRRREGWEISINSDQKMSEDFGDLLVDKLLYGGFHWISPIKMLTDANLWRFSFFETEKRRFSMRFTLPFGEPKRPFTVSDKHIQHIKLVFLGFGAWKK